LKSELDFEIERMTDQDRTIERRDQRKIYEQDEQERKKWE